MNKKSFDYRRGLPLAQVQRYISSDFTPPLLLKGVNTDSYAKKLSANAEFLIYSECGKDVGFIAYYENSVECEIYITLIAVRHDMVHRAFGSAMLENLISRYKCSAFRTVKLEVDQNNLRAYNFYVKHGFQQIEDRGQKLLMRKDI